MAQWVKNLPAIQKMQETWVQSLGLEDLLEEDIAAHSRILAWRIPWTEEPCSRPQGHKELDMTEATEHTHTEVIHNPTTRKQLVLTY